jgi:hypothetical protein
MQRRSRATLDKAGTTYLLLGTLFLIIALLTLAGTLMTVTSGQPNYGGLFYPIFFGAFGVILILAGRRFRAK